MMKSIPPPLPDRRTDGRGSDPASPAAQMPRELPAPPLPPAPTQPPAPTAAGTTGKTRIMVWMGKPALPFPLPQPGVRLGRVSSNN